MPGASEWGNFAHPISTSPMGPLPDRYDKMPRQINTGPPSNQSGLTKMISHGQERLSGRDNPRAHVVRWAELKQLSSNGRSLLE